MPTAHDSQPMEDSTSLHPTGDTRPDETWRTDVALFRYTLILPLLRHDRACDGTKLSLRTAIAAVRHTIPHSQRHTVSVSTLRRWEKAYRDGGFEALKPPPRSDRGATRAVSTSTLDRAEALKRELPSRSSRTVADILKRDQAAPIPETCLAPRTLRRHLAARGATTARLLKSNPVYRRFERSHFGDVWQSDAMDGPRLPDPAHPDHQRQTFLFAFLDDHTRLVPHAQFYPQGYQFAGTSSSLAWKIVSSALLCAMAARWPSTPTRATSTAPSSSTLPAPPWASNVSWPNLTRPRPRARSNASPAGLSVCRLRPLRFPARVGHLYLGAHPGRPQPELTGLDRSRLSPQGPLRNRPVSPGSLPPGPSPGRASRRSPHAAHRLPVPRHPPRQQNRLHQLRGQSLRSPWLPGRSNYKLIALRVELRYDPFDLLSPEIWFKDQFLTQVQPLHVANSLQPGLKLDPAPPPPPPSTGLDYLAMLRQERERLLQEQMPPIPFTRLNPPQEDDHVSSSV
jgi:hypothetical protein